MNRKRNEKYVDVLTRRFKRPIHYRKLSLAIDQIISRLSRFVYVRRIFPSFDFEQPAPVSQGLGNGETRSKDDEDGFVPNTSGQFCNCVIRMITQIKFVVEIPGVNRIHGIHATSPEAYNYRSHAFTIQLRTGSLSPRLKLTISNFLGY